MGCGAFLRLNVDALFIPSPIQGNIGATSGGLHFLEEEDIIPVIVEIAEQSHVLSVRG